jgi:hypothetical protein
VKEIDHIKSSRKKSAINPTIVFCECAKMCDFKFGTTKPFPILKKLAMQPTLLNLMKNK